MTYPPGQPPFPGADPSSGGSGVPPYGAPGSGALGGSPYAPGPLYSGQTPGGSPYGAPPNPYSAPQNMAPPNPYSAPQNMYGPAGLGGAPPSNNIGWAIAAIFLFWPLAIPAFIASGKVDDFWRRGDFAGAQQASADAKKWGSLGVWIGVGIWVVTCCVFIVLPFVLTLGMFGAAGVAGSH